MLHVPTGANTYCLTQPSWGTTRPNTANGTAVTPGTGAYGTYAQMVSSVTDDAYGIFINANTNFASNASRNTVVEIGIDPSGSTSYTSVVSGLVASGASEYTRNGSGVWYYFPLFIKAGSSIAARAYGSVATAIRVGCVLFSRPSNPAAIRKGSFIETLGVSAYTGTSITPGGASEGAWTSIGTTTLRTWWVQFGLQIATTDTAWTLAAHHVDVAVGNGSSYDVIISDANFCVDSGEYVGNPPLTAGVEWDIPAGSTMYMRVQSSGTPDSAYEAAVYCLGG